MQQNRDTCIELVFGHEKGFVNRPKTDAGGATNMGITQKTLSAWRGHAVTVEDVRKLTKREAYDIYAKEYWHTIRGDELPAGLDYALFDSNVTSGANRTIRMLQKVLKETGLTNADGTPLAIDGNIGTQTLNAISRYPGGTRELIRAFCAERMRFMRSLKGKKGFASNGRGWTIRVTGVDPKGEWATVPGVVGTALKMVNSGASISMPKVPQQVETEAVAKTDDSSQVTIPSIVQKPEGLAGLLVAVTGLVSAVQGNSVLSYALGAAMIVGVGIAGYTFYQRLKLNHA